MAWLQQFLQFMEDIETSYHFIERGADVFEGEYDLRVMFKDDSGNSPVGITPTTTTTSTKMNRDQFDDYVTTLNALNSWALFVVNISLEREDCRDKSFDPKGAELKADLDSAVMADVALCCILRSVFLLLGMMTEDKEDSSYADVSASSLPKQHAGSEENAAQRHVSPDDGHIYEIGHDDDESAQSQSTDRNLSGLIQVLDINDKGFQNRRGSLSLSLSLNLRAGGNRTEDNTGREKLSMSLQCLCLLVRSSSDTLRVAAAGILDPSPHEFLLDIRNIALALASASVSVSVSDPVLPALPKGGLLPFGDFKNALDLDCHRVRGEGNDEEEDDAVASSEGKYEFNFMKISRTSRDLANNILQLIGPSSVEGVVENSDSDSSRMAHAGEGLSNKVKGKNRIDVAGNKEGDAAKMRIKEEKVTLMVIAMCRIWSNWPNSRLADMLVVRGIMSGFEAMGVRVSSAKHSTIEGLGGGGGVMGSKYVSGSKSSEEQASSSPAAASVPSSSSPAFQPPVLLSSAALAASVPLGLRLVDRFQQQDKCLGIMFLRELVASSSGPLIASISPWLTPMLFEKLKTATHEPCMDVLTSRLLQTVIIASIALPVGTFFCHIFLEEFTKNILFFMDPKKALPSLIAVRPFLLRCPKGGVTCHLSGLVHSLLALINRWHVPSQIACLDLISILMFRCSEGMKDYCAKICVETFRVELFLDAGVGDLSG